MADDPRRLDTIETVLANLKRQIDGLQNTTLNRLATHVHPGGGGGVTDHGALTGLGDDDHTQYHNDTRGDIRYYTKTLSDAAYQPKDSDLTTIAGLTATTDNFLQAKASVWASRTPTQVAADLVTPLSSSLQPLDSDLTAIAALSPANGTFIKRVGGVWTAANIAQSDVTGLANDLADLSAGNAAATFSQQTTTSTSYTDLATVGPTVSITLNSARRVLVIGKAELFQVGAVSAVYASWAASGATTIAADDGNCIRHNGNGNPESYASMSFHDLNAGTTTFTMKYRVQANTGRYDFRSLAVIPI